MRRIAVFACVCMAVVAGSVILSGCGRTQTDTDSCFAEGKKIEGNTELQAILVDNADGTTVEKTTISMEETESFGFGMTGERGEEDYYGTYELCNLDTGKVLQRGEFVFENYTFFEKKSNPDVNEATGNTTAFVYESEGEQLNEIQGPGNYAVSTFSAVEGGEWKLTDTFEFEVVE